MPQNPLISRNHNDVKLLAIGKMTSRDAFEKLAEARWGDMEAIVCPRCGEPGRIAVRPHRTQKDDYSLRCGKNKCGKVFSVTCGTAFDRTKLSNNQLYALFASYAIKVDMTVVDLMRDNDFSYKTAAFALMRMRSALAAHHDRQGPFTGNLEIDGAIFCHRVRHTNLRAHRKANGIARRLEGMASWVIALLELEDVYGSMGRPEGKVSRRARRIKVFVVNSEREIHVNSLLGPHIADGTVICTDGMQNYKALGRIRRKGLVPPTVFQVDHDIMFQTEGGVNENTTESFFGLLKEMVASRRGISPTYVAEYAKEAAWRRTMNNRPASVRLAELAKICLSEEFNPQLRGYTRGSRRRDYELRTMEYRTANGIGGKRLSAARRPLERLEKINLHDRQYRVYGGASRKRRRERRNSNGGCRPMTLDALGRKTLTA